MFSDNANEDTQFCHFYHVVKEKTLRRIETVVKSWPQTVAMDVLFTSTEQPDLLMTILKYSARRFTVQGDTYRQETYELAQGVRIPFRSFLIRKT